MKKELELLINKVEKCHEDDEFKGYKASPLLKEMVKLLEEDYQEAADVLALEYEGYRYIANKYDLMGRFSLGAKYNLKALEIGLKMYQLFKLVPEEAQETLRLVLRDRNFYVDDDCEDVFAMLKQSELIPEAKVEEMHQRMIAHRRTLKHDPVEMSEAYLAVIDEVEERIDQNRTIKGMGSCFEIWDLKETYLAEKGISWMSPALLNPRVRFD